MHTDKVLLSPARCPKVSGKKMFFLFSLDQVRAVLAEINIRRVPFSSGGVRGISLWEEKPLPVICPEECLGLSYEKAERNKRFLVVRVGGMESAGWTIIDVSPSVRMQPLPEKCQPVPKNKYFSGNLIHGAYDWEDGRIVFVVNLEKIVAGGLISN